LVCVGIALWWQVVEINVSELNDIRVSRDMQPITHENRSCIQREGQGEKPDERSWFGNWFYHAVY
jgi:hypothetical protein